MKNLLEQNSQLKPPKVGDIVEGKLVAKERGAVFFDLGTLGSGIVYGRELKDAKEILKSLKTGDATFVKIIEPKNEQGYIELSLSQVGQEMAWEDLRKKKENREIVKIKIIGANKGGLLAEHSAVSGFLPVSQLSQQNYPKIEGGDSIKILKELQKFVGKELEVLIFDADQKNQKLIFSEKAKEAGPIRELLKNYQVGQVVEGEISGIVDFGAFVKFGDKSQTQGKTVPALEGLIHISELDWKLLDTPSQVVKMGQKVQAKIIGLQDDKVFLSLKALKEDPWKRIDQKYKKGDRIQGKVTKLNPFGAFVQITEEIQGLCHISELGSQAKMEEKLKMGEVYQFEILEIRPSEHKMSLKLTD